MTGRENGRAHDELRPVRIHRGFIEPAEGSVLMEMGRTRVICTVTVEDRVPPFLKGKGAGWITAEYGMLPRATGERSPREVIRGRQTGRTMEIQRLIGRALRSVIDLKALGERTLLVDCDVIQADGGTRTASVTGSYVALVEATERLRRQGAITRLPIRDSLAAVSVGVVAGQPLLDLDYREDSRAEVDMNLVMTGSGGLVEVQGTGEEGPFTRGQFEAMLNLGERGIRELMERQREALGPLGLEVGAIAQQAVGAGQHELGQAPGIAGPVGRERH